MIVLQHSMGTQFPTVRPARKRTRAHVSTRHRPSLREREEREAECVFVAVGKVVPEFPVEEHVVCEVEGVEVASLVDDDLACFLFPFV
jgi:hypothetical protein